MSTSIVVSPNRISALGQQILILVILLVVGMPKNEASAFVAQPSKLSPQGRQQQQQQQQRQGSSSPASLLFMSDVPQEDDKKKNKRTLPRPSTADRWWKLPPPPEDQFVLIGDLLSLSVYGISDHWVCQIMSQQMVPTDHDAIVTDMVVKAEATLHAPVWWEAGSPQAAAVLQATMESHLVTQYSPLLEPMGQATTLLAASWLLAGWFHRAFSFQNTLDCPTDKALTVTAKTWLTTCAILFGLVAAAQALTGMEDWATHFHKGDLDFIMDSLTVLVVWRFMASSMLGGGSK